MNNFTLKQALISALNIKGIRTTKMLGYLINQHPQYPNLVAIQTILSRWKANCFKFVIDDLSQVKDEIFPFIVQQVEHPQEYGIIISANSEYFSLFQENGRQIELPINKFSKLYSPIAIGIDAYGMSSEPNLALYRVLDTLWSIAVFFYFICIFSICTYTLLRSDINNWLVATIALKIGALVLLYQFAFFSLNDNELTKKICGTRSAKNNNCKNTSIRILEELRPAHIGIVFLVFATLSAFLGVLFDSSALVSSYVAITFCTAPVLVYLLIYQLVKTKVLCRICTSVYLMLVFDIVVCHSLASELQPLHLTIGARQIALWVVVSVALSCLLLLRFLMLRVIMNLILEISLIKDLMTMQMSNMLYCDIDFNTCDHLTVSSSNLSPRLCVTLIVSPNCDYCKEALIQLGLVFSKYESKLDYTICFRIEPTASNEIMWAGQFADKSEDLTLDTILQISDTIPIGKDQIEARNTVRTRVIASQSAELRKMLNNIGINNTPALVINDRLIPTRYPASMYLDVVEHFCESL